MKRDMDLVRELLLFVEENHAADFIEYADIIDHFKIQECSEDKIIEHCKLLVEKGLVRSAIIETNIKNGPVFDGGLGGLTYEGHDFLDSIRDKGFWVKIKNQCQKTGGYLTVETIKLYAMEIIKASLGSN